MHYVLETNFIYVQSRRKLVVVWRVWWGGEGGCVQRTSAEWRGPKDAAFTRPARHCLTATIPTLRTASYESYTYLPPPWFKQAYRSGAKKTSWNAWLKTFCESIYFNHCASNSYYWFKWPLKASRNKTNYLKISRNRVDGGGRRLHIGRPSRVECIFIVFLYQTTLLLRSSTFYFLWALMFLQKVLLYAGSGEMYTL